MNAALQTYTITVPENIDISDTSDGSTIHLRVSVRRSGVTKLFSIFVMTVMWVLSLVTLGLALIPWLVWKKVEPPTISFGLGLLFALPAIRNAQPGVPPIGNTSDVVSFFWSMMLTASACCIMMVSYIVFQTDLAPIVKGFVEEKKKRKMVGRG
ncbi:hypothetical protein BC829DRAFT_407601 [Chytridium lagenaria]|nr:hypothetical protein BC829DRAFT_407601 [Chytridium lagenaria]